MLATYFVSTQRLQELRDGRGGALLERYSQALNECGYAEITARRHIRAAEHLLYWAEAVRLPYGGPRAFRAVYRVSRLQAWQDLPVSPYINFQINQVVAVWSFCIA